jgi:ribosomal protein S18 acetylase RimI-like enzyme
VKAFIRPATVADGAFQRQMTYEAFYWNPKGRPPIDQAMNDQRVTQYFDNWGRPGDFAFVAADPLTGRRLGMTWARLYPEENQSFGFVAPDIPEASIAVAKESRGRGIAPQLLGSLFGALRQAGFAQVSGAVDDPNPAIELWERMGFTRIELRDGAHVVIRDLGLTGHSTPGEPEADGVGR